MSLFVCLLFGLWFNFCKLLRFRYDRHKEALHTDPSAELNYNIDESYYSKACYNGYGDDDEDFYAVYRHLFEQLIEQEVLFNAEAHEWPGFGKPDTAIEQVKEFYAFWQSFATSVTFSHLDEHDIRQAENRRVVRLMEKDNAKIRNEAKKERNAAIKVMTKLMIIFIQTKIVLIQSFTPE